MITHPFAELFPLLPDAELQELAEDIKKNGLLEPIVLYEQMILDGRNLLRACQLAGVTPIFITLPEGTSPISYVTSKNLYRRHLTTSQRAAIAVEITSHLKEDAMIREYSGRKARRFNM